MDGAWVDEWGWGWMEEDGRLEGEKALDGGQAHGWGGGGWTEGAWLDGGRVDGGVFFDGGQALGWRGGGWRVRGWREMEGFCWMGGKRLDGGGGWMRFACI